MRGGGSKDPFAGAERVAAERATGMIDWARAQERQRCAEAMCWRCRAGHEPVKVMGNWVHRAPPIEGTSWCSANNIHKMEVR